MEYMEYMEYVEYVQSLSEHDTTDQYWHIQTPAPVLF